MAVSTNRWDLLDPPEPGRWSPRLTATVILPYYQALPELRRALIALAHQTYPRELTEIVVVDDGSEPPLQPADIADITEKVTVINRSDQGFRLATARNDGATHSSGDVLAFLDGDMMPEPGWLESHLRWHHVEPRAVVLGTRRHIDTGWLTEVVIKEEMEKGTFAAIAEEHTVQVPEWIEFHFTRTSNLTGDDDDLFRVVTGGNLSISRDFFARLGGFDDSFVRWGGEDTEFGYRAWVTGALLIPDRGAMCWHQGLGVIPDPAERVSQNTQRRKLAHLIPHHSFRVSTLGRTWMRPMVVADVTGSDPEDVIQTCVALLETPDLLVLLRGEDIDPAVSEEFGPDPRVRLIDGPPDYEERFTPFIARVPAGLTPHPDLISDLIKTASRRGAAKTLDGVRIESRRHVNTASRNEVLMQKRSGRRRSVTRLGRIAGRLSRIRTPSDAAAAARWLFGAVRRRLPSGNKRPDPQRTDPRSPRTSRPLRPDPWTRVAAIGIPGLPATGRLGQDRLDLIVTADSAHPNNDEKIAGVRILDISSTAEPELLSYPPLEPKTALAAIKDNRVDGNDLLELLQGMRPSGNPPGRRTRSAVEALRNGDEQNPALVESVRRAVLAEHHSMMRLDQLRRAADLPPCAPSVSVLLASRRADRLNEAVASVAKQSYQQLELILALHGIQPPEQVLESLRDTGVPHEIIQFPIDSVFGSVLSAAARRASGQLLAKMDDDDLYSPTHVEDLVNAYLLSGADLVGKAAEYVYLKSSGVTIRRFVGGAYTESRTLAGGAMAVTREAYEAAGGWADVSRHVDQALLRDVIGSGGTIFRTHGLGYVLVRHGDHTWHSSDDSFLDQSEERWEGLPDWITGLQAPDLC